MIQKITPSTRINLAVLAALSGHMAMEPAALAQMQRKVIALPADIDVEARYDPAPLFAGRYELLAGMYDDAGGGQKPAKPYEMAGGVAIIRLSGLLQKEPSWLMRYYGGTSTRVFCALLNLASSDPDVGAICVVGDSYGGNVDGTAEAADAVYQIRLTNKKPIVAVVDGACCSACYWIASQCSLVYAGRTSLLGSIGTRWSLIDTSAEYEMLGLKRLEVTTGTYKAAGADGLPITTEDVAYFESIVTDMQVPFSAAIVRGRKLSTDAVKALSADAKIYVGKNAQDAGLIDGLASVSDVVRQLQKQAVKSSTTASPGGTGVKMALKEKVKAQIEALTALMNGTGEEEDTAPSLQSNADVATLRAQVQTLTGQKTTLTAQNGTLTGQVQTLTAQAGEKDTRITAMQTELDTFKAAQTEAETQALDLARTEALTAATTAFGPGTPELERAKHLIDAQANAGVLASMTAAYKANTPTGLRPGAGRQTAKTEVATTEQNAQSNADFYAGIRAEGEKANSKPGR